MKKIIIPFVAFILIVSFPTSQVLCVERILDQKYEPDSEQPAVLVTALKAPPATPVVQSLTTTEFLETKSPLFQRTDTSEVSFTSQAAVSSAAAEPSTAHSFFQGDVSATATLHAFSTTGVSVDSSASVFGGTSGSFSGTNSYLDFGDSPDWTLGSVDFTIDFRTQLSVLPAAGKAEAFVSQWYAGKKGSTVLLLNEGGVYKLQFYYSENGVANTGVISGVVTPSVDTWYHIAVVRNGGEVKLYFNGAQVGTTLAIGSKAIFDTSVPLILGGAGYGTQNSLSGRLDEVRISNTARWTSNFSLPTAEYTRDANTKLLLHFTPQEFQEGSEQVETQPQPDTQVPTVPSGLTVSNKTSTSVTLSWDASTDNVGVTGYQILRDGTLITTVSALTYQDTGLLPDTSYHYQIRALDAAGNQSELSTSLPTTTQPLPDNLAPSIPADVTATVVSPSQITLNWAAATDNVGVTNYQILRGGVLIATVNALAYEDTGLAPDTSYSYQVRALDAAGNQSGLPVAVPAKTQALPPAPVVYHKFVVNNATVDSSASVFGGTSGSFSGTNSYLDFGDSPDWALGSVDFTIDFRTQLSALPAAGKAEAFVSQWYAGKKGSTVLLLNEGGVYKLQFYYSENGVSNTGIISGVVTPSVDTWYHVAVVRNGDEIKLYFNGIQVGTTLAIGNKVIFDTSVPLILGGAGYGTQNSLNGRLDEVRISSTARWTSNFSLPSTEYTRDENTRLLLHFTSEELAHAVATPTVHAIPALTNQTSILLQGEKPANAAIWINGQLIVPADTKTTWSTTYALEGDGEHTLSILAKDALGNASDAVTAVTTLDTIPPVIVLDPATPNWVSVKNLTVNYTVDGVAKTKTFSNLVEGENTLTITGKDAAGNETTVTTKVTMHIPVTTSWIYSGSGSNLWSVAANWLGGHVPSFNDIVIFGPSAIGNCIIDTAITVQNMIISSGYTGTITQRADVHVTGDFVQASGKWVDQAPASHAFTVGGSFSIPVSTKSFNRYGAQVNGAYQVRDVYDLQAMEEYLSSNFQLTQDIDASSTANWNNTAGFNPIGTWTDSGTGAPRFTGNFNGNHYTISGLTILGMGEERGLFGCTAPEASISNVGLMNVNITGGRYSTGGLVGSNRGTITNVFVTGTLKGSYQAGGLVGWNDGAISNSYAAVTITGDSNSQQLGGLIGLNNGILLNLYASGAIRAGTGSYDIGGLVGLNNGVGTDSFGFLNRGTVTNSYAIGITEAGAGSYNVGGLIGKNNSGSIINSGWWTGAASSAIGSGSGTVAYNESDKKAFENSSHGVYTAGTEKWDIGDHSGHLWIMLGLPHLQVEWSSNITNVYQLQMMKLNLAASYALANNIDASATASWNEGKGFIPIGSVIEGQHFTGSFNGTGFIIDGLTMNRSTENYVGFFGYTEGSSISNVGFSNIHINGLNYVGGLAGVNDGSVSNVYVTGTVSGQTGVGGLIGYNFNAAISGSSMTGAVEGFSLVGGLVGENGSAHISNSYVSGAVTGLGYGIGGLVGSNYWGSVISNCYSSGTVTGAIITGGLAGFNYDFSPISNSYSTSVVMGQNTVGGLVAMNSNSMISNSYFTDTHNNGFGTFESGGLHAFYGSSHAVYGGSGMNPWDFTGVWALSEYDLPRLRMDKPVS